MADPRFKLQLPIPTVDAFCLQLGYEPLINGVANSETKNLFVARKLKEYVEGNAACGKVISVVNARKTEDATLAASVALTVPVEIT